MVFSDPHDRSHEDYHLHMPSPKWLDLKINAAAPQFIVTNYAQLYVIKESLGQPVKLLLELAWTFKQTKTQNVPSTPGFPGDLVT